MFNKLHAIECIFNWHLILTMTQINDLKSLGPYDGTEKAKDELCRIKHNLCNAVNNENSELTFIEASQVHDSIILR